MRYVLLKVGASQLPQVLSTPKITLKFLQGLVGGYIQVVPMREYGLQGIDCICNEEGMYAANGQPLPANRCGLLGDFVVVAHDDNGEVRDFTDQELLLVGMFLREFWNDMHPIHNQV